MCVCIWNPQVDVETHSPSLSPYSLWNSLMGLASELALGISLSPLSDVAITDRPPSHSACIYVGSRDKLKLW